MPALTSVLFYFTLKWRLATASLSLEIRQEEPVSYIYTLHGPLLSNSFNNLLETENLSRITISIHQARWSRRASHDLVSIFPIWSCMSCNKLLQSHLLRHFHYLNGISLVIWLLHVLYLVVCMSWKLYALVSCWLYASDGWLKFQSIFDGLQSIATDDEKHYQCQNIVLNKKNWTIIFGIQLVNSIIVFTDGGDIVESADKVFGTGQFDFYFVIVALFELVVLLSDSFTVVPKSWA